MNDFIKFLRLKRNELNLCMKSDYVKGQLDLVNEMLNMVE